MKPERFDISTPDELRQMLRSCWAADTSDNPSGWSVDNPSYGQCAVTALIVQDVFGGTILRCLAEIPGRTDCPSHYANLLPSDQKLDLTRDQFPSGTMFSADDERTRQYILKYPGTMVRYGLLLQHLGQYIAWEKLRIKNRS